jgi:NADH:ubiquinone oxidoreductase subunit 6 (subunit J)
MNKQDKINKLIEEALNSVDDAQRAEPRPFLLTRIHARMNKGTESVWEKAGWFITRPAVAFTGLCMIVLLNVMVVMNNKTPDSATVAEQTVQTQADEFSYTAATIYDNDNTP